VRSFFVFHFLRWYPSWVGLLPRHAPRLAPAEALLVDAPPGKAPNTTTRTEAA
jgi:cardiolipin synthase